MDTTNILADTTFAEVINQTSAAVKDTNPYAIFVMGLIGVFAFALLYMAIMKLVAVVDKK